MNVWIILALLPVGRVVESVPSDCGNLIANGSFERRESGVPNAHIETLKAGQTDLVGWAITTGSVDWIGPTRWRASQGDHSLDVDAPGGITQNIKTTPGGLYRLQFDLAGNVELGPPVKPLRVAIGDRVHEFTFDTTGHTRDDMGWLRKEIVFTATCDSTTLVFSNPSPAATSAGVAVDNVVVSRFKAGRYSVTVSDKGPILLDTATGETWMLLPYKESTAWLPIERINAGGTCAPAGSEQQRALALLKQLGATVTVKDGEVREVDLTNSRIRDGGLGVLGSVGSLEHLTLAGCSHLSDAGLVHLKVLGGLKGLNLGPTNISDAGLKNLKTLTELNYLSLNGTRVGDPGIQNLVDLTKLEVLYLNGTSVTDAGLAYFEQMTALHWLDLGGTKISDLGLARLAILKRLRLLSVNGTAITDAGLEHLTSLSNLECLNVSDTNVSDGGAVHLSKLPKLKQLDLRNTRVTLDGIASIKAAVPDCKIQSASGQTVWMVDQGGGGDFLTIQEGIDAASHGDTVLVADGTYLGPGNKDLDFGGKAITVKSENGPDRCIIDGEGKGRGVCFHHDEGPDSVLEGFTITRFDRHGILIKESGPTINNCRITRNTVSAPDSRDGAGILVNGHPSWHASPLIKNCTIKHNFGARTGGGIRTYECSPTILNCDISFNEAMTGGGVAVYTGNPTFTNCTIAGNTSINPGGGIHVDHYWGGSGSCFSNCVIRDNSPDNVATGRGDAVIRCCDIGGGWEGSRPHCSSKS